MIDAYATLPHYAAHLAPIWWALPAELRGTFYLAGPMQYGGQTIEGQKVGHPPPGDRPTMIAGFMDEANVARPVIYVEHGAGQTYTDVDDPSYNGSAGHDKVRLFVCPNDKVANRWRLAYPGVTTVVVGCPRLDRWHLAGGWPDIARHDAQPNRVKVAAITFHHNSQTCPETKTAWPHYAPAMATVAGEMRRRGWRVIGHWHPRLGPGFARNWMAVGVEPVASLDEVFARADVLCGDNTSALPEAASIGIPIVFMNAPWYRRDVHHGGRFWTWANGQIQVDEPHYLPDAIERAHSDPMLVQMARAEMVRDVYKFCDGKAAERAARSIAGLVDRPAYTPAS